ncbi:MAG: chorismate-binding protein, partial [Bacteroidota bacterium]|nr:chorismate-binding protein [Bacteroidota bacterium]
MDNFPHIQKHGQEIDRAFLFSALQSKNVVLLETARTNDQNKKNLLFLHPKEILVAASLKEIPSIFEKIEYHLARGKYIAGYFSYECGYHFENIIEFTQDTSSRPLIWLGVFDQPIEVSHEVLQSINAEEKFNVTKATLEISKDEYEEKLKAIHQYILNGDTYQVNFTDRITFDFTGNIINFYCSLREKQHVSYSALIRTEFGDILSFSPELFFKRDGKFFITKPMKGTSKRGRTSDEDRQLSQWLHLDEKNRSENLMIVDL